jgi:hypothetical protein
MTKALLDLSRADPEIRRKRLAQGGDSIFTREIIYPAVAFGLAQHRDNRRRHDLTRLDQTHQAGHITGAFHRDAGDESGGHVQGFHERPTPTMTRGQRTAPAQNFVSEARATPDACPRMARRRLNIRIEPAILSTSNSRRQSSRSP